MKKIILLFLVLTPALVLAACGSTDVETPVEQVPDEELATFTLSELAEFDGRDGRDAYVAVDGFVYDVTGSPRWPNGLHQGQHQAGQDLTQEIMGSPHGEQILSRMPRIGRLVEE